MTAPRCPKCSATSGGDWSQCRGSCPMLDSPHYDRLGLREESEHRGPTKHAFTGSVFAQAARAAQGLHGPEEQLCEISHYAANVEAQKDVEIYWLGAVDCSSCLRRMADKHQAIAEMFREKLAALGGAQ